MKEASNMDRKTIRHCRPEELSDPMNLYIYAAHVIKGRLPDASHEIMAEIKRKDPENPFVSGYFKFIERETLWSRFKRIIGVRS